MRLSHTLLGAGLLLIGGACYKTEDPAAPIVNFSVTPSPATIDVRVDSLAPTPLSAVVKDKSGTVVSGVDVNFVPDDATIVGVFFDGPTGSYYAYGRQAGTTRIRVTYGATSTPGYITVTVRPRPVVTVDLLPATASLVTGGTQQFTATLLAGPADTVKTLRFGSAAVFARTATYAIAAADAGRATVTATGRVTAVAPGTARVIARYKNTTKAATFTTADTVTVADTSVVTITQAPAATFTVTPASATIAPKGAVTLRYSCRAANGTLTTCATPTAVSDNPTIADVGVIDPVAQTIIVTATQTAGTSGNATITITSGTLVATAIIAVR
jgi:hypothetical protein